MRVSNLVISLSTLVCVPLAAAAPVSAVEFYNIASSDFFLTTDEHEIALLDSGATKGWLRAFTEFKVEVDWEVIPDLWPVHRFYSDSFPPASPHFYTAFPEEFTALRTNPNSKWIYEGIAFWARRPDASGACAAPNMPIYRTYNGGEGGAPKHRFSPYPNDCPSGACIKEGPGGVAFCVPASLDLAKLRTDQMSLGKWQFSYPSDGATKVVDLAFGPSLLSYPPALPPRYWPESPYRAPAMGTVGVAGWDPIASKIDVVYFGTFLQFDFDGVEGKDGCAYLNFEFFSDGRGACVPLTIKRM